MLETTSLILKDELKHCNHLSNDRSVRNNMGWMKAKFK